MTDDVVKLSGEPLYIDFADFEASRWLPVREDRRPGTGRFIREKDCITNFIPEGTSQDDLLVAKDNVGYAMTLLKDFVAGDGRLDVELATYDLAAPTLCFRMQHEGEVHKQAYMLVTWDQSRNGNVTHGLAVWKYLPPPLGKAKAWQRLAYWSVPIPRQKRLNVGLDFKGENMTLYLDGVEVGGLHEPSPLPAGKIGLWGIEGPSRFYSLRFTPAAE